MGQFLDETIKPEYGVSRQGYSRAFLRHLGGGSFNRGGWDAPTGCLFACIDNFSRYDVDHLAAPSHDSVREQLMKSAEEKKPGIEAFAVFLDPEPEKPISAAGLTFRWYEADKDGVRMTGEVEPTSYAIGADSGYTFVFSYRTAGTTYFGFFSRLFFAFGKDCVDYTLLLYNFRDGKWQWLDGIHSLCDINDITREDLDGFIEFARKYGMNELADRWDITGKLSMNLMDYNVLVHFKWSNNLDNSFVKALNETPVGELVPGYEINVETAVYKCYFPM